MNLKTFNATNATKKGAPSQKHIRMYRYNGLCYFSKSAVRLLDIRIGDMIALHQDLDDRGRWYIEKVNENGIEVKKPNDTELGFYSKILIDRIFRSMVFTKTKGKVLIDSVPVRLGERSLYALDFSKLKND